MRGIARYMRQQADLIEKGTKILERDAASYLADVGLNFDEFTLSDNSTNELFQLFTGMVDGKLENKRMYEAVFCSVLEDERYFFDAWVLDDYYDVYVPGSDVSIDFAFSLYKVDKRNQCSFFNQEDRAWEHIRAEDMFSEIGLLVDEEACKSGHPPVSSPKPSPHSIPPADFQKKCISLCNVFSRRSRSSARFLFPPI